MKYIKTIFISLILTISLSSPVIADKNQTSDFQQTLQLAEQGNTKA